jgi:aarF domain-containing kinase
MFCRGTLCRASRLQPWSYNLVGRTNARQFTTPPPPRRRPLSKTILGVGLCASGAGLYYARDDVHHAWIATVRSARTTLAVFRIALDYQLTCSHLSKSDPTYAAILSAWNKRSAERVLELCRTNGGIYIKLGQHLSAMTYILPPEWTETLEPLQARCPPTSLEDVAALIELEMGKPMHELFREFDPIPLGVASLAQVHRAVLVDGREVAVKIQHPPLKEYAMIDVANTSALVRLIERLFPDFGFGWLATETETNIPRELNFCIEQENADIVRNYFAHDRGALVIPKIYWATPRVLCMEFINGSHINDRDYLAKHHINPNDVSTELARVFADMIFKYGWVHCDPHPGNILIRPRSRRSLFDRNYDLVLLDHGLYRELPRQLQVDYAHLWRAIIYRHEDGIREYALRIGGLDTYRLFACILTGRSWSAVETDLSQARTEAERDYIRGSLQKYLRDIAHILRRVPREILLLIKTQDLLRSADASLGTTHHPGYNFMITLAACNRTIRDDAYQRVQTEHHSLLGRSFHYAKAWFKYMMTALFCRLSKLWMSIGYLSIRQNNRAMLTSEVLANEVMVA